MDLGPLLHVLKLSFSNFISLGVMILSQHHLKLTLPIFRVFLKIMKNGLRYLVALTPSNVKLNFFRNHLTNQSNLLYEVSLKRRNKNLGNAVA